MRIQGNKENWFRFFSFLTAWRLDQCWLLSVVICRYLANDLGRLVYFDLIVFGTDVWRTVMWSCTTWRPTYPTTSRKRSTTPSMSLSMQVCLCVWQCVCVCLSVCILCGRMHGLVLVSLPEWYPSFGFESSNVLELGPIWSNKLHNFPIFCSVYDGHAGTKAATTAAAHLHEQLVASDSFNSDPAAAIQEAIIKTDQVCYKNNGIP